MFGVKGLAVYQKAYECVLYVYKETEKLPKSEIYGLSSQIRRAAVSVVANMSEGYAKREQSAVEYKRFLLISKGSANEIITLASVCSDVGYMPPNFKEEIEKRYTEINNMLFGIINKL